MDYSVAEMNCILKVDVQCEACKAKVYEILQNIYGVYTIEMNAEEGTVKIHGKGNPNTLLRLLQNSETHAEVKSVRFDGEVRDKRYYHFEEDYTSSELPYPHPFFDYPQPLPPPYPWQTLPPPLPPPVPWSAQLPPLPPPPPATWPMPMWQRPPSIFPSAIPRPPWQQSTPAPPPPDEVLEVETPVVSSNMDNKHTCCTIM